MRFWISWYGGDGDDPRPVYGTKEQPNPPPFPWWCSGYRDEAPECAICAVVDAEDEAAAWKAVRRWWPETEERFCNEVAADWMPDLERFPVKSVEGGSDG